MVHYRNLLTHEVPIINVGRRYLRKTNFSAAVLALMILTGIFSLSLVASSLIDNVIIRSSGQISVANIVAKSGYWQDIQEAVNWVVAHGGIGNIYLPEGTWNFVNVGESMPHEEAKVLIPAGINLFGASTERTSGIPYNGTGQNPNDQVVEWKTVLVLPWDAAGGREGRRTWFFSVEGNGNPSKQTRISDIAFVGYREFNHTCESWHGGIIIDNVIDFRVDHCLFKHCTGGGVYVFAPANGNCCGVVDHCRLVNDYGSVDWDYAQCSMGYGVMVTAVGTTRWEDDITKVVGQYTPYTVFIEDCYFKRWRHCVSSNDGVHYVFRHNTIEFDSCVGSLDAHGTYNYVGTRAVEIYNNLIIDPVVNWNPDWDSNEPSNGDWGYGIVIRGGGGVIFNNYIRNYLVAMYMRDEGTVSKCWPHDIWIWNNTLVNYTYDILIGYDGHYHIKEGVDYFLYEPSWYIPYPYPHPLTIKEQS